MNKIHLERKNRGKIIRKADCPFCGRETLAKISRRKNLTIKKGCMHFQYIRKRRILSEVPRRDRPINIIEWKNSVLCAGIKYFAFKKRIYK